MAGLGSYKDCTIGERSMKTKHPKFPKTRTCLISDMLTYASTMNGLVKDARKAAIINEALTGIAQLSKIPNMRWGERRWALKALDAIEKIGIMDRLELLTHLSPQAKEEIAEARSISSFNQMGKVATSMGLQVHKVNGRVIVIRKSMTEKSEVECNADKV